MNIAKEIDLILEHLPSQVMKDENLKNSLLVIMAKLGQSINRGCPDCYNKAYYRLLRMKQNNYIVEDQENTYLFRKNLHGYRAKKTGKVLNNHNSTVQERKDVFNTSKSHQSLFAVESIPLPKPKKTTKTPIVDSFEDAKKEEKSDIKKTRTPRKKRTIKAPINQ
jgi:hypothetical protein